MMKQIFDFNFVLPCGQNVLNYFKKLDSNLAAYSNPMIATTSSVLFLTIRYQSGRKYKIDWESLVHALITGIGGSICLYLDLNVLPGFNNVRCHAPTSLHRVLPAITQGYAICDILNGLQCGGAFLAHGIATLLLTSLFTIFGVGHVLGPMLVCEVSTILLSIVRNNFFTPLQTKMTEWSFFIAFLLCRIIILPYLSVDLLILMWKEQKDQGIVCDSKYMWYVTVSNILFFNGLNCFWFAKILRRIPKKMQRKE